MSIIEDILMLGPVEVEAAERLTLRWIFQAMIDFGSSAHDVFLNSPDEPKDVAEDITREALDRLPGFNVPQRIYGTVDYKRARYIILPDSIVRQALFVDSKAEKESRSATLQMSQTSLYIRQIRSGVRTDERGLLPTISLYAGKQYLTTTVFLHFEYHDIQGAHILRKLTLACLPNGLLQERYNPTADDNIWLAGRNAPTLGELFRARLSFAKLAVKARWRVQRIEYDIGGSCEGIWME